MRIPILFFCLFFAGCATITKGGKYQEITVDSNTPGAIVEVDGVELGYTPFKGIIKKDREKRTIKVSKPGYFASDIEIAKKRDNKTFYKGNISLGLGISGAPFFAGGMYENFVDYPKRKKDYEDRKSRGETAVSEDEPKNEAVSFYAFGTLAAAGLFGLLASTDMTTGAAWEYSPSSYYVQLKEIGQSNSDFSNELSIRYFATMNHSQIAIDAGENNGEYAEALANIMETKMDRDAARQGINEALEKSKGNQVMFGDALMERFRRQ